MKKLIQWLARVFKAEITKTVIQEVEKIVYKDKVIEKEVYVSLDKEVNGNCTVKGDLTVNGTLTVTGEVTSEVSCYKIIGGK